MGRTPSGHAMPDADGMRREIQRASEFCIPIVFQENMDDAEYAE